MEKEPAVGSFLGRLLISPLFILGGLSKIFAFEPTVLTLKQAGLPSGIRAYLIVAVILELGGGLLLLAGWKTRLGCWLLMIFLLPATVVAHGFWNAQPSEAFNQSAHFFKNVAIYGGLALIAAYGPGRWSLDSFFHRAKPPSAP